MIKSISPVSFGATYKPFHGAAKNTSEEDKAFEEIGSADTEIKALFHPTSVNDADGSKKFNFYFSVSHPYLGRPAHKVISVKNEASGYNKIDNANKVLKRYILENPHLIEELEDKSMLKMLLGYTRCVKVKSPEELVGLVLGNKSDGFREDRIEDFLNMARGMLVETVGEVSVLIAKVNRGWFGKDKERALDNITKGMFYIRNDNQAAELSELQSHSHVG